MSTRFSRTPRMRPLTASICSAARRAASADVLPPRTTRMTPSVWAARATASETERTGGVSMTMRSKTRVAASRRSCMRRDAASSAWLGGSGPLTTTERLGTRVGMATSARLLPSIMVVVRPRWLLRPKILWRVGLRRSPSTRRTREPDCAHTAAKLAAVVVLPSAGAAEVLMMVLQGRSRPANWMLVRSVRYASAAADLGAVSVTRAVGVPDPVCSRARLISGPRREGGDDGDHGQAEHALDVLG